MKWAQDEPNSGCRPAVARISLDIENPGDGPADAHDGAGGGKPQASNEDASEDGQMVLGEVGVCSLG